MGEKRSRTPTRTDVWVLNEKALPSSIEHEPTVLKPENLQAVTFQLMLDQIHGIMKFRTTSVGARSPRPLYMPNGRAGKPRPYKDTHWIKGSDTNLV